MGRLPELSSEMDEPAVVIAHNFLLAVWFFYPRLSFSRVRKIPNSNFHERSVSYFHYFAYRVRKYLLNFFFPGYPLQPSNNLGFRTET